MDHAYFLAPSSFCFHFLKKEEVDEREKEDDFILLSPQFPLSSSLKGKKRKIK